MVFLDEETSALYLRFVELKFSRPTEQEYTICQGEFIHTKIGTLLFLMGKLRGNWNEE